MNRSGNNADKNQSVNASFAWSLPLSPFENVETKIPVINRKCKATWEDGGIVKKKRIHWDTQAKKQLFNTKTIDKKKYLTCSMKKIKQTKVLHRGVKRTDGRELSPTNGNADDQVNDSDFPSKSGNTHGKVKVTVSTGNDVPTKRVPEKKIHWSVSTIPYYFKFSLANVVKSVTHVTISPIVNINNNIIPYPATSSIDKIKSNWETNNYSKECY